jgi:lipopolysaccharide transport system ATP-binding protein
MKSSIQFENVSKYYRLGGKATNIREELINLPKRILRKDVGARNSQAESIWAVRGVSFQLQKGQILGIIGPNGAGKTTILKLLSGVTRQTEGSIKVDGRLSALIELGAGFHPDLTGRENIFLNGVILGLKRKEIVQKFDDIVAFAELEKFIDTPVKHYSSGMYARLAFSVAAHSDPDILLVDEVLAVGDENFQRKCFDFLHAFVNSGKTAVFVSHNTYVIEQLCQEVIWLNKGRIFMHGTSRQVLNSYLDKIDEDTLRSGSSELSSGEDLLITQVKLTDNGGNERQVFSLGDDINIHICYRAKRKIEKPHFCLVVFGPTGEVPLFQASMLIDGNPPPFVEGDGFVTCHFKSIPLMPRTYFIWGEVFGADRTRMLVVFQRLGAFNIMVDEDSLQQVGSGGLRHLRTDAPIFIAHDWHYNRNLRQVTED